MRKRLVGCLYFLIGLLIGLVWVLADIVTKNPVNKLTSFNIAVLLIILSSAEAYLKWQAYKRNKAKKQSVTKD